MSKEKTSELLKCPFCGNNDRRVGIRRMGNKGYRVVCGKCGGCGPYVAIKDWHDNKMIAQGQAIKAWNTRKPMQNIVERLEEELRLAEEERDRCPIKALPYYDSVKGYANGVHNAIEIVKEEDGV